MTPKSQWWSWALNPGTLAPVSAFLTMCSLTFYPQKLLAAKHPTIPMFAVASRADATLVHTVRYWLTLLLHPGLGTHSFILQ